MRYRMTPCGNSGPIAKYDIEDLEAGPVRIMATASFADALRIVVALNASSLPK
jgi:hypothetical protein